MKLNVTRNRLANLILMAMLVGVLTMGLANTAVADCPCFKTKDFEKLIKKDYEVEFSLSTDTLKLINFKNYTGDVVDQTEKGKGEVKSFQWSKPEGYADIDVCAVYNPKYKWKGPWNFSNKSKDKHLTMSADGPESVECAAIIDQAINSLP